MGKKITLEIDHWARDNFDAPVVHSTEARFKAAKGQDAEEFEQAVNEQAYKMLMGIHTNGFIGHDPEENQFFTIKPSDIDRATATISDTIDIAE